MKKKDSKSKNIRKSKAQKAVASAARPKKKPLVVFYSLEGNTAFIAKIIASAVDADVLELVPKKEISKKSMFRFFWGGRQVFMKEEPELNPLSVDVSAYETIFIGTPVWAWTFSPPIKTFFSSEKKNLAGKKIAFFCCSGGAPGKTVDNMKKMLSGNAFIGEIQFRDPLKHDKNKDGDRAKEWAIEVMRAQEKKR